MKTALVILALLGSLGMGHATVQCAGDESRWTRSCIDQSSSASEPPVTAELGELNRKARTFPQPIYPRDARLAGIQGKVIVRIIVDASTGDVVWAQAQSGPVELREPALTAACMAAFFPTMDVDSKVGGFLAYTFGKRR